MDCSFALPDLRGRTPIHVGTSNGHHHSLGQKSGEETHTLAANEMPQHNHPFKGSSADGDVPLVVGNVLANSPAADIYSDATSPLVDMSSATILNTGGGQAHNNMQPVLALNFCIALQGLFPSRN